VAQEPGNRDQVDAGVQGVLAKGVGQDGADREIPLIVRPPGLPQELVDLRLGERLGRYRNLLDPFPSSGYCDRKDSMQATTVTHDPCATALPRPRLREAAVARYLTG
jgi:hypothetical protein